YEISEGSSFDANPLVIGLALIGWVVPSSVPSNIPLLDGKGLTPAFVASISDNLSRWPQGPQLADPFWLLMGMWHVGLFATLIFGTVGYNLRK
nr:Chain O2, Photosystem I subunit O [Porphyridium purpureum]7Y5E_ON Chain ON, Photosystem I subunit O [Porphyridium purpureum]7Y7A_O7 Chain O7, Photosystem I subunit O [Porphyridium purpureum]7Y7A_Oo Chain Oo, Photosystem I subunit O [Porphyridium purpureum]